MVRLDRITYMVAVYATRIGSFVRDAVIAAIFGAGEISNTYFYAVNMARVPPDFVHSSVYMPSLVILRRYEQREGMEMLRRFIWFVFIAGLITAAIGIFLIYKPTNKNIYMALAVISVPILCAMYFSLKLDLQGKNAYILLELSITITIAALIFAVPFENMLVISTIIGYIIYAVALWLYSSSIDGDKNISKTGKPPKIKIKHIKPYFGYMVVQFIAYANLSIDYFVLNLYDSDKIAAYSLSLKLYLAISGVATVSMIRSEILDDTSSQFGPRKKFKIIFAALFLSVTATIVLSSNSLEIVKLIFERGAFDVKASMLTSEIFGLMVLMMPLAVYYSLLFAAMLKNNKERITAVIVMTGSACKYIYLIICDEINVREVVTSNFVFYFLILLVLTVYCRLYILDKKA